MSQENVAILRRWFEEVWNEGREELMPTLLAENAVIHGTGGQPPVLGPAGFLPFYRQIKGAFPDIKFTVDKAVADGDLVAFRWTARMTHSGDHLGVRGTGKPVTITGMSLGRVADGMLCEGWDSWDALTLFQEIGMLPPLPRPPDPSPEG